MHNAVLTWTRPDGSVASLSGTLSELVPRLLALRQGPAKLTHDGVLLATLLRVGDEWLASETEVGFARGFRLRPDR